MREIILASKKRIKQLSLIPLSIGLVYLWFGSLKFFAGVSPAENLAKDTIHNLTLGLLTPEMSILLLAVWETLIGVMLIFNIRYRLALNLALVHIVLTFSPFIFFPDLLWTDAPFGLTLLGQYIIKNIVFLGVLLVLLWKARSGQKAETV